MTSVLKDARFLFTQKNIHDTITKRINHKYMSEFSHEALDHQKEKPLIYTAMSKHVFYYRTFISAYVLENGGVPLNPFMIFDYFLSDLVDRNLVREGNNNIVMRADELWVFGDVSNGVLAEILIAKKLGKKIKYFEIQKPHKIVETTKDHVQMEDEVAEFKDQL